MALEDKIVQKATVTVLNCIYEEEFLGFSYVAPGLIQERGKRCNSSETFHCDPEGSTPSRQW